MSFICMMENYLHMDSSLFNYHITMKSFLFLWGFSVFHSLFLWAFFPNMCCTPFLDLFCVSLLDENDIKKGFLKKVLFMMLCVDFFCYDEIRCFYFFCCIIFAYFFSLWRSKYGRHFPIRFYQIYFIASIFFNASFYFCTVGFFWRSLYDLVGVLFYVFVSSFLGVLFSLLLFSFPIYCLYFFKPERDRYRNSLN